MTISGGRTEQLVIVAGLCCITGFTSDFLSFIVVEHIRFFHGALQLLLWASKNHTLQCASESLIRGVRDITIGQLRF